MDRIKFLAVLRAVKEQAAKFGYRGDVLADADEVPLVGTMREQLAIATIGAEIQPPPTNDAERRLLSRLIRAAVLTSPAPQSVADHRASTPEAIERANRQAVAHRRQRTGRTRR